MFEEPGQSVWCCSIVKFGFNVSMASSELAMAFSELKRNQQATDTDLQ